MLPPSRREVNKTDSKDDDDNGDNNGEDNDDDDNDENNDYDESADADANKTTAMLMFMKTTPILINQHLLIVTGTKKFVNYFVILISKLLPIRCSCFEMIFVIPETERL